MEARPQAVSLLRLLPVACSRMIDDAYLVKISEKLPRISTLERTMIPKNPLEKRESHMYAISPSQYFFGGLSDTTNCTIPNDQNMSISPKTIA